MERHNKKYYQTALSLSSQILSQRISFLNGQTWPWANISFFSCMCALLQDWYYTYYFSYCHKSLKILWEMHKLLTYEDPGIGNYMWKDIDATYCHNFEDVFGKCIGNEHHYFGILQPEKIISCSKYSIQQISSHMIRKNS